MMPYFNGQLYEKWVPEEHDGKIYPPAVDEAIDDYINYLLKWEHDYPLFKETIDKQIDAINNNREEFVQNYVIPKMPHMTEADFDDEAPAGL